MNIVKEVNVNEIDNFIYISTFCVIIQLFVKTLQKIECNLIENKLFVYKKTKEMELNIFVRILG